MKRALFGGIGLLVGLAATVPAYALVVGGVDLGTCERYYDGCNTCSVGSDGAAACTMMACVQSGTPKCLDSEDDTSLEDLEDPAETGTGTATANDVSAPDFSLKTFSSCSDMEDTLSGFIERYYRKNPSPYPILYRGGVMMEDAVTSDAAIEKSAVAPTAGAPAGMGGDSDDGAADYSETNVQIAGVDESEIVKTDGKYAYYYNSKDRKIYIADVRNPENVSIVRKIKVPDSYYNPEIYVGSGKLVLFSGKYSDVASPHFYWYDRAQKSVVVVYDIAVPSAPKIERYYQIDGSVSKTRRVGKYLYLLSTAHFSFPYDRYYLGAKPMRAEKLELDSAKIDRDFSVGKVVPKKVELSKVSHREANFRQNGKLYDYRLESGNAGSCESVEYVLPSDETMEKYSFTPSLTTLSVINLENASERVKTQVFFGDVAEIMMTPSSLYLTSQIYSDSPWKCPPFARCILPFWGAGNQTVAHRLSLSGTSVKYVATGVIPGTPLNQYSMDEDASGNFRIVTSETGEKTSTRVSVLDASMKSL